MAPSVSSSNEWKSVMGLDYAWNRYYSSTWGRFTTADPSELGGGLESPQEWNRYGYVEGDPVNRIDPTGLFSEDPCYGDLGCQYQIADGVLAGAIDDWDLIPPGAVGGGAGFLQAGAIPIPWPICMARPDLCVLGGLTIYYGWQFANAVTKYFQARTTARRKAPVQFGDEVGQRDSDGKCKPPQDKMVKWRGSDDSHWHWYQWNLIDPATCTYRPTWRSGPDPGPEYREIPR